MRSLPKRSRRVVPECAPWYAAREAGTSRAFKLSEFGPGPWVDEPDDLAWEEPGTEISRVIHRIFMGALCGYIALPELHPWAGRGAECVDAYVHGGVAYSGSGLELLAARDSRWHVGFDCAHGFDVIPSMAKHMPRLFAKGGPFRSEYRDINYVRGEVESLALQALIVPSWAEYRLRAAAARSPRKKRKAQVYAALAKRICNRRLPWRGARAKRSRKTIASWKRSRLPAPAVPPEQKAVAMQVDAVSLSQFASDWLAKSLADVDREN